MAAEPHYFGIRHHGPGCARSLRAAFDTLQPDCVLIEGPPESDALIGLVTKGLQPPVALLGYCPDTPGLAVYHPFAEFSPEWQAMCWAVEHGVPVRFIDLPLAHGLAIEQEQRAEADARVTHETGHPQPWVDVLVDDGERLWLGGKCGVFDDGGHSRCLTSAPVACEGHAGTGPWRARNRSPGCPMPRRRGTR